LRVSLISTDDSFLLSLRAAVSEALRGRLRGKGGDAESE